MGASGPGGLRRDSISAAISLGRVLVPHATALIGRPIAYLSALRLAFTPRRPGARALLWSIFHSAETIVLARRLREDDVRHLHDHVANAAANVSRIASPFLNVPWSLTLHGTSETDYPAGLL